MPSMFDIGKRAGMAFGASLFTKHGQSITASSEGLAAVTNSQMAVAVQSDVTHAQLSTTLTDVTGLLIPIGASATEIWFFELYLLVTATTGTVDIKYGWTYPSGTTMQWGQNGSSAAGAASFNPQNSLAGTTTVLGVQTDTFTAATQNTTTAPLGHSYAGFIFGGGTAGNAQFQFAQNNAEASNLTIKKGSMLRYRRVVE